MHLDPFIDILKVSVQVDPKNYNIQRNTTQFWVVQLLIGQEDAVNTGIKS